jgi:hypothetical protein
VVPLVLIVSSLVFGIAVGRWWALVAAIPVGIAVGLTAEIEIPGRYLGSGYGVVAAITIGTGVLVRRLIAAPRR